MFIGSSLKFADLRVRIGCLVNCLSYEWEKRGVRIHLNRWEDYEPGYSGVSKQDEYDEDLVKKSSLMIGLFGDYVGKFTERELDAALKNGIPVHCISLSCPDPSADSTVAKILSDKGLARVVVKDEDEVLSEVRQIINDNVRKNLNGLPHMHESFMRRHVYATIASDVDEAVSPVVSRSYFADMIRTVDDIAEDLMRLRCILHPYNKPDNISCSDYYVSVLNDVITDSEYSEIESAFKGNEMHRSPSTILTYICEGGNVKNTHYAFNKLISDKEAFPVSHKSLDTIKLNLLLWLFKSLGTQFTVQDNLFSLKNDMICFLNHSVADINVLEDYGLKRGTQAELEASMFKILYRMFNNGTSDVAVDPSSQLDLESLMYAHNAEEALLESLQQRRSESLQHDIDILSARVDCLSAHLDENNINELLKTTKALAQLYDKALEKGISTPMDLLSVLFDIVFTHDTYSGEWPSEYDIDEVYGDIVKVADNYAIIQPQVEMLRVNYANSFLRRDDYSTGLKLYEKALNNIDVMSDDSPVMHRLICNIYTLAMHMYMNLCTHSEALFSLIARFRDKLDSWKKDGCEDMIGECMYYAAILRSLPIGKPTKDDMSVLEETEKRLDIVLQANLLSPSHHNFDDLYCYLPNNIMAFYIDRWEYFDESYLQKVLKYYEIETENAVKSKSSEIYLGMANHNLGFLYSKLDPSNWPTAYSYYKEAYNFRKRLPREMEIAETAVNIGGLMCQMLGRRDLFKLEDDLQNIVNLSDEAIGIYKRYLRPGAEEREMNYYKAIQLKGSLLYMMQILGYTSGTASEGLKLMMEAWEWNVAHPQNNYRKTFETISGIILKREKLI